MLLPNAAQSQLAGAVRTWMGVPVSSSRSLHFSSEHTALLIWLSPFLRQCACILGQQSCKSC